MSENTKHPLQQFWTEKSGWSSELHPLPEMGLSEGTLCIETWNAAIQAVIDSVDMEDCNEENEEKIHRLFYRGAFG